MAAEWLFVGVYIRSFCNAFNVALIHVEFRLFPIYLCLLFDLKINKGNAIMSDLIRWFEKLAKGNLLQINLMVLMYQNMLLLC